MIIYYRIQIMVVRNPLFDILVVGLTVHIIERSMDLNVEVNDPTTTWPTDGARKTRGVRKDVARGVC